MKRYLLNLAILMFVALFLSSAAGLSFADDAKIYPGITACRANSSQPVPEVYAGGILNPSSSQRLHVYLPICHDAGSIDYGWIRVFDRHRTRNVICDIWSIRWPEGSSEYVVAGGKRVMSADWGSGVKRLDFSNDILSDYTTANYISCLIPPEDIGKSGILSYRIVEE